MSKQKEEEEERQRRKSGRILLSITAKLSRFLSPVVITTVLIFNVELTPLSGSYSLEYSKQNDLVNQPHAQHQRPKQSHNQSQPTMADGNGGSACLLIRDENFQLSEWLAYHYISFPLKHLVVTTDPVSLTSPSEILNRWRDIGMEITEWSHEDYYKGPTDVKGLDLHVVMQRQFFKYCSLHHKKMGRTWVALTDVDEYLVPHRAMFLPEYKPYKISSLDNLRPEGKKKFIAAGRNMSERDLKMNKPAVWDVWQRKVNYRMQLPPIRSLFGNRTIMDMLADPPLANETCVMLPRILITGREYPKFVAKFVNSNKPENEIWNFTLTKFRTFRFHRFVRNEVVKGKGLVDVSRNSIKDLSHEIDTIHSPFPSCGFSAPDYESSILQLYHYVGSLEEFTYKRECRKTKELYEFVQRKTPRSEVGQVDDIAAWLPAFVSKVGEDRAALLLQGVGYLQPLPFPNDGCLVNGLKQAGRKTT